MAKAIADFINGAHIHYKVTLSNGEDEEVNELWGEGMLMRYIMEACGPA